MSINEAWAIGLFEGEGCISIPKTCNSAIMTVKTTDLDVAQRLQDIWGGRLYKVKRSQSNIKQPYVWKLQNKPVVRRILSNIIPHLSERRACKASDAIDRIDNC